MKETEKVADEIYAIGVKNGSIFMKNKIMKSLNRDWKLFRTKPELDLLIKVLKKIEKISLPPTEISK